MTPTRSIPLATLFLLAACAGAPAPGLGSGGERNAFGNYLVGRSAEVAGDTALAASAYQAAIAADPGSLRVRSGAFRALLLDGRVGDAVEIARGFDPADQREYFPGLALSVAEAKAGSWRQAEARLRGLPRQRPPAPLLPLALAWSQAGQGATDSALATLAPLQTGTREGSLASLHAGLIAERAGRLEEAARQFRAAQANGGTSLQLAVAAAGFHARGDRPAEVSRVLATFASAGDESAMVAKAVVDRGAPPVIGPATDGMAEAFVSAATIARGQDDANRALAYARLALELRSDLAVAWMIVADHQQDSGQLDAALATLNRVRPEDPLAPAARMRQALLLDRLDRTAAASQMLEELARSSNRPEPLIRLGDLMRLRKRNVEAISAYDRAFARIERIEPRHWALYFSRAIALERNKDWTRAEADLNQALELAPEQPFVLNYLAYTWADQGKELDRSRRMLERAIELSPDNGQIIDSLGWVLFRQGDYRAAVKWLERAVELEPKDPTLNDHLGDAYWKVGRTTEARFQWWRALSFQPEPEEVPKIEAKLRSGLPAQASIPPAPGAATR